MSNKISKLMLKDAPCPITQLLIVAICLIIYLTARSSGYYPMIFADEWFYSAYSRYIPAEGSIRPSYLFFKLYRLTNYCGDAFLDCARQINIIFFAISLPVIYSVCRRFAPAYLSLFVSICAVFSPISSYSAFFMPESMYFFLFWLLTWTLINGFETRPTLTVVGAGVVLACMSLVKAHAIVLFPALLVVVLSNWIITRNYSTFMQAVRLGVILITSFFLVRLALGYVLVGVHGLNIMGSDYGGIAHSLSGGGHLASLLPMAGFNLWGHVLTLAILFGVPLLLITQMLKRNVKNHSELERKQLLLALYTSSLLISLLLVVALYAAQAVSIGGPYESIGRLSLRYYDFTFPLLLIIAATALVPPEKYTATAPGMKWFLLTLAILVAYAIVFRFRGYQPTSSDSPQLLAITAYMPAFLVITTMALICLFAYAYNKGSGVALYLFAFYPLTTIYSASNVYKDFIARRSADVYDQAGQFANRYLGKDTAILVVFGPDLGSLYRAHFYMTSPVTSFFPVPSGQRLHQALAPDHKEDMSTNGTEGSKASFETNIIPDGKEWLLLIGNYKYSFDPLEKINVPVRDAGGNVTGDFTLMRIGYPTSLQVMPNPTAHHHIGRFDLGSNTLIANQGESGALLFGPYKRLRSGRYEVTYTLTANSNVAGTQVGTLDVSGYIPPGVDDVLARMPLRSANGEQVIKLTFDGNNPAYQYQFRVWLNGLQNDVNIRSVSVKML